ncbi:MAG: NAD(P)(+) transhydrogenase (Re/Si-specific) subunit beta, partial [Chloroflexi bacterium]|nr:NAD(P)(+) transhydrogenase (Re/Si-specific) subunit beta [Chloroflexota bacterium]
MPGSALYTIVFFAWLLGAAGFVIGLHQMNSPATARAGNRLSAGGMDVAVLATLIWLALRPGGLKMEAWIIIIAGFLLGGGIGLYLARSVKMTAMPQLVSVFNAVGGGAAALVAVSDYFHIVNTPLNTISTAVFVILGAVIGSITFSGSIVAAAKLQGLIPGAPIIKPWTRPLTLAVAAITGIGTLILVLGAAKVFNLDVAPSNLVLIVIFVAAIIFGVTLVLPIGGADMP